MSYGAYGFQHGCLTEKETDRGERERENDGCMVTETIATTTGESDWSCTWKTSKIFTQSQGESVQTHQCLPFRTSVNYSLFNFFLSLSSHLHFSFSSLLFSPLSFSFTVSWCTPPSSICPSPESYLFWLKSAWSFLIYISVPPIPRPGLVLLTLHQHKPISRVSTCLCDLFSTCFKFPFSFSYHSFHLFIHTQ